MTVGTPAVAEVKLTYSSNIHPNDRRICYTADDCHDVLAEWWDRETIEVYESFAVLFLDRGNRVIGLYDHSRGGSSATVVDTKLVIATALTCRADSIVLAHNHPSGALKPSQADVTLTKKLATAAKFHDMRVLDHLLLSPWDEGYYSFANSMPEAISGYDINRL